MSKLVHKSVYIEPEVWQRLKVNAELSDLTLRDYLRQIILDSEPLAPAPGVGQASSLDATTPGDE